MKKLLCSLLVVGLGLGLVACGDKKAPNPDSVLEVEQVAAPKGVTFDNKTGKVTWKSVKKASSYIVSINNVEYK